MAISKHKVLAAALLMCLSANRVEAAALSTDVGVTLPSMISLYCFDNVDVNVTSDGMLAALARTAANNPATLTRNARGRNGRWIVRAPRNRFNRQRFRFRNRVNLTMTGVCAVRAVSGTSGVRVRIDAQETTLETPSGASMDVIRVQARDTALTNQWRRRYNIAASNLGPTVVRDIDIRMRLDLRNASEAGKYSSASDGTFTVTVVARP